MREILFLPLDVTLDGLNKGPSGIRPPQGMRAPAGSKGPPGQQPKLGAGGMGGKPPAPKMGGGGAGPGGGSGKKYDYVKADKPPPGNAGRTPGGYWKVPVGSAAAKQMSPDNEAPESTEKKRDPLSGQSVSSVDERVSKIHAETSQPDPAASDKPESFRQKQFRKKKEEEAQATADTEQKNKIAEEGIAARNSMKDEDFKYEPKLEGEPTGEPRQAPPGSSKKKATQQIDMYSTDEKDFESAHPATHYALADKFRKDGDSKLAHFHEQQAAKKTEGFGHAEHAELSDTLHKHGLHKEAAKHGSKSSSMRSAEMKQRDPNWQRVAETDGTMHVSDDEVTQEVSDKDITESKPEQDPAKKWVSEVDEEDSAQPKQDPIEGQKVENLDKERASEKAKRAVSDHKEAGSKKAKELSDKHAAGEKEIAERSKKKASDMASAHEEKGRKLAEGHSAREKELSDKHKTREKELTAKHEAAGKELSEKHSSKQKELTQAHRDAQDEHAKAQKRVSSLRSSEKPDKAKIKEAQKDVAAAKELITESKRKLDDHKVKSKEQMSAHKEKTSKELAAHKEKAAAELSAHKEKASTEIADHKSKGKAAAAAHKEASEKELSDHRTSAKKEMDAHAEQHSAQAKELGQQHEQAKQVDAAADKQAKEDAKAQQKAQKEQEKAQAAQAKDQAKAESEKAANVRRPPANDQEKLQAQGHADKARKIQENLKTHLNDPNLDPQRRETLQQAHDMLQEHIDGGHVPTPEMTQQMKDVEKAAGEHGKKPSENVQQKPEAGGGAQKKTPGISAVMANAYNQGAAAGNAVGAAAASPYSGALGHATLHYGTKGVASGGHYLLSPPTSGKSESEKATDNVASKRNEPAGAKQDTAAGNADDSTETVSANKHVAKGLRLYVKAGWQR